MIALAAAMWGFLLVRTVRRTDRRRLPLRLTLLTAAMSSLLLAGLSPGRRVPVDPGTMLLITPGADQARIDSLQRAVKPQLVATFDSVLAATAGATLLPDAAYLVRHYPAMRRLHVVGSGLPAVALEALSEKTVYFYPGTAPAGITDFQYLQQLREGDPMRFSGRYRQVENETRRLFLESPHGKDLLLASDSAGRHTFALSIPARQRGRYLFQVVEEDADRRVLRRAPLPVLIDAGEAPRTLILNQAPSFETKYLKNWLADHGYPVAVRSAISRDRYQTGFYNRERTELLPLRPATLTQFDVVVVDAAALPRLPPGERSALRRAVEEGLGLIILAGGELPGLEAADRRFFFGFPLRSGASLFRPAKQEAAIELPKGPYNIEPAYGVYPLLHSSTGGIVAAYRLRGTGRLTLQLAGATYRLLLDGREAAYQQLWTNLLEASARRSVRTARWRIDHPLSIQPHHPVTLHLISDRSEPAGQLIAPDSTVTTFYFRQEALLPDRRTATVWPRQTGWHRLELTAPAGDSTWFYVPPAGAWEALRQMSRQEATARWIARRDATGDSANTPTATAVRPYPRWWWYLLFLLAAGGLWVEEKIRRN